MPPSSTTSVLKPSDAPYTAADRPAGPQPTITRSKSVCSGSTAAPAAWANSALVGSVSTFPSGKITTGSFRGLPAPASRSRPEFESARQNVCGIAHRPSTSLSSYARPDQTSPTTRMVCGATRVSRAHSRRKLEMVWWKTSSGEPDGRST